MVQEEQDNRIEVGSALDPAQTVVGSAFDPQHFQTVLLIMLNRLYDVNLAFLATVNPQKATELYDLHERGLYLSPPPSIAIDNEEEDA